MNRPPRCDSKASPSWAFKPPSPAMKSSMNGKAPARFHFPLGRVTEKSEKTKWVLAVPALPWLILTDASHHVMAEGFALDELDAQIKKLAK